MEHPPISIERAELMKLIEENLAQSARIQDLLKEVGRYEDRARESEELATRLMAVVQLYADPVPSYDGGMAARGIIHELAKEARERKK